jgi:hypothetical protein
MQVHVGASQSNMPAGLAAVLNILQGSITGSEPGGEITLSPTTSTIANRSQAAFFEIVVKDDQGLLVPDQEISISLQAPSEASKLKLKPLGISPGTAVGTPTPTEAKARTNDAGVVGVTVEIAADSPASTQAILKLGTSVRIAGEDVVHPVKTASAQLTILPQSALPPPPTEEEGNDTAGHLQRTTRKPASNV